MCIRDRLYNMYIGSALQKVSGKERKDASDQETDISYEEDIITPEIEEDLRELERWERQQLVQNEPNRFITAKDLIWGKDAVTYK